MTKEQGITNRSLDESLQVSASAGWVRITWLVETQKWTQMNLDIKAAQDLIVKLKNAIEAAQLLWEREHG